MERNEWSHDEVFVRVSVNLRSGDQWRPIDHVISCC